MSIDKILDALSKVNKNSIVKLCFFEKDFYKERLIDGDDYSDNCTVGVDSDGDLGMYIAKGSKRGLKVDKILKLILTRGVNCSNSVIVYDSSSYLYEVKEIGVEPECNRVVIFV